MQKINLNSLKEINGGDASSVGGPNVLFLAGTDGMAVCPRDGKLAAITPTSNPSFALSNAALGQDPYRTLDQIFANPANKEYCGL